MKFKKLVVESKKEKQINQVDVVNDMKLEDVKSAEEKAYEEHKENVKVFKDTLKQCSLVEGYNYTNDKDNNYTVNLKNRSELAKLVESLKQNNIKHRISRSKTEGYRYDVTFKYSLKESENDNNETWYVYLDSPTGVDLICSGSKEKCEQKKKEKDAQWETGDMWRTELTNKKRKESYLWDSLKKESCKGKKLKEMFEPISSFKEYTYIDKTNQGWEIKKAFRDKDDDRLHVVVYRPKRNDYAVGLGYSPDGGYWNQGWYDYVNIEDAISDLKNEYNVEPFNLKLAKLKKNESLKEYDESLRKNKRRIKESNTNITIDIITAEMNQKEKDSYFGSVKQYNIKSTPKGKSIITISGNKEDIYDWLIDCGLKDKDYFKDEKAYNNFTKWRKNKSLKESAEDKKLKEGSLRYSILKKGDKVKLDKEKMNLDKIQDKSLLDDTYEVVGFWYNQKLVDDDMAPEHVRDLSGVRIKNTRTGKEYDINRFQLTSIDESLKESYDDITLTRGDEQDDKYIIIEGTRDGYSIGLVEDNTITVEELIDYLEQFDSNTKVVIGNDWQRGDYYTYGSINESTIRECYIENEEPDDEDDDLEEESLKENKKKKENIEYFDEDLNETKINKKQPKARYNGDPIKSAKFIADGTSYNNKEQSNEQQCSECNESVKDDLRKIGEGRPNYEQCFEFENGTVLYVDYDEDTNELYAGELVGGKPSKDFVIEYDSDFELQPNLEELYSIIIEKHPEFLDSAVTEDFTDIDDDIEDINIEDTTNNDDDTDNDVVDYDFDFDDSEYIDIDEIDDDSDLLNMTVDEVKDVTTDVAEKSAEKAISIETGKDDVKLSDEVKEEVKNIANDKVNELIPEEDKDEDEQIVDIVDEEGKKVDFKESLKGLKKIKFVDSNNNSKKSDSLEEALNEEIIVDEDDIDDEPFSL